MFGLKKSILLSFLLSPLAVSTMTYLPFGSKYMLTMKELSCLKYIEYFAKKIQLTIREGSRKIPMERKKEGERETGKWRDNRGRDGRIEVEIERTERRKREGRDQKGGRKEKD